MSVATVHSAHIVGLQAEPVAVDVDVSSGLYSFSIVGLPDKAVDESKDRVIAALKNTGLRNPKTENHKVTVSLAPAHIKKEGSHFDLPIALAYLLASKQLQCDMSNTWFVGELSLAGEAQPLQGVLPIAEKARECGIQALFVPDMNKEEAALIDDVVIYGYKNLREVVRHFGGIIDDTETLKQPIEKTHPTEIHYVRPDFFLDFKDIRGQETAKRALEIAAAGGHNIALYGPPGTGKTMLARAFTGVLPPLSKGDIFEVTRIHSVAHTKTGLITHPPFRSPHHTSSYVSLVGGGASPKPGEVTLAHRGVLFLDEFPEFDKRVIEALRQPLEEGTVTVSRAKGTFSFPASCIVITAMNPCPCGYMGSKVKRCVCKASDIDRYARKLSGPIMDRIDMWVPVQHIDYDTLSHARVGEESTVLRIRVQKARDFARERFINMDPQTKLRMNKDMHAKDIAIHIKLEPHVHTVMQLHATKHTLSPRGYHRILRLARTIADMEQRHTITESDILEAFQYRPKLYENRL
jgi:magnesium chelatase family protein